MVAVTIFLFVVTGWLAYMLAMSWEENQSLRDRVAELEMKEWQ